jgi:hypothetical protein
VKVNPLKTKHISINSFKSKLRQVQPHPEDRLDAKGLFMKSKYEEALKKKELLLLANKEMSAKLNNLKNNNDEYIESKQLKEKPEEEGTGSMKQEQKPSIKPNEKLIENNQSPEQIKEQGEEELNQEELKDVVFNDDQFKEYTYVLIKNFEVQNLNNNKLKEIFDQIDKDSEEIVLNDLALKIAQELKITSLNDQSKILIYIHSLLVFCDNGNII